MDTKDFLWFIEEREAIRLKKEAGLPRPWTDDYILANCRFCNIDRVHDRGTVRILNFISGMSDWEKVFYITLYRSAISSQKFLDEMTGLWIHDCRNLKYLQFSISDSRKPYQVFLRKGDTIRNFLAETVSMVAKEICSLLPEWAEISILEAADQIADIFLLKYGKRMVFLSTEIVKDLTYIFPDNINPDSECFMNIGAKMGLKKQHRLRRETNIEILLDSSGLNFSSCEHGLCEWNKYLVRKNYYRTNGELKKYWLI